MLLRYGNRQEMVSDQWQHNILANYTQIYLFFSIFSKSELKVHFYIVLYTKQKLVKT